MCSTVLGHLKCVPKLLSNITYMYLHASWHQLWLNHTAMECDTGLSTILLHWTEFISSLLLGNCVWHVALVDLWMPCTWHVPYSGVTRAVNLPYINLSIWLSCPKWQIWQFNQNTDKCSPVWFMFWILTRPVAGVPRSWFQFYISSVNNTADIVTVSMDVDQYQRWPHQKCFGPNECLIPWPDVVDLSTSFWGDSGMQSVWIKCSIHGCNYQLSGVTLLGCRVLVVYPTTLLKPQYRESGECLIPLAHQTSFLAIGCNRL